MCFLIIIGFYFKVLLQSLSTVLPPQCVAEYKSNKWRSHLNLSVFCLCLCFKFNPTPSCRSIPNVTYSIFIFIFLKGFMIDVPLVQWDINCQCYMNYLYLFFILIFHFHIHIHFIFIFTSISYSHASHIPSLNYRLLLHFVGMHW